MKISDIDDLTSDMLVECKIAAHSIIETISDECNHQISDDKAGRKALGLVLKAKDRKRSLLTELGELHLHRDYYYDNRNGCYVCPLDDLLCIRKYELIDDNISVKLVAEAAEVSYAKRAQIVTDGEASRHTVRNHILKLSVPEKEPNWSEKKKVKEMHQVERENGPSAQCIWWMSTLMSKRCGTVLRDTLRRYTT